MEGCDIDWFFTDKRHVGFAASAGGKLPDSVLKNFNNNHHLTAFISQLPNISEVIINPKLAEFIGTITGSYLNDFITMAKKGLFAFDRTVIANFDHPEYHLVASPVTPIQIDDLPPSISELFANMVYKDKIETFRDINLLCD